MRICLLESAVCKCNPCFCVGGDLFVCSSGLLIKMCSVCKMKKQKKQQCCLYLRETRCVYEWKGYFGPERALYRKSLYLEQGLDKWVQTDVENVYLVCDHTAAKYSCHFKPYFTPSSLTKEDDHQILKRQSDFFPEFGCVFCMNCKVTGLQNQNSETQEL